MNENKRKLFDILMSHNVKYSIKSNLDDLFKIIPELRYLVGFEHKHPHHHLDVWNHTLYALDISELDFDVRLTLLLHDIGKPFCFIEEDEVRHFHGHPLVSKNMANDILNRIL